MSNQNQDNEILFWCLEQHREHYEKAFKNHPNVKVNSIENLLTEQINEPL